MATNSGWLMVTSGIRLATGLITTVLLTRFLGPEEFGLYSYVIAFVMIFVGLSSVGMVGVLTRDLVEDPSSRNQIMGTALGIRLVGSVIALIALVVVALALHSAADQRLYLLVFGIVVLFTPLDVVALFYESRTQWRYVAWVQLPANVVYVVVLALLVANQATVVWLLAARLMLTALVQGGVLLVFWMQGHQPSRWRMELGRARRMTMEAWPVMISAAGAVLYLRIDQVMLGQMSTAGEVGVYSAAARLSEVWYFLPGLVVASAFPFLLRLRSTSPAAYRHRLQQLYDLLAWMGAAVAVAVFLFAPWLVGWLFGPEYSESVEILRIHVWAGVFIFMRAAFSKWLIAERLLGYSLLTQGGGAVANIAINLVLIPRSGAAGAAIATVLSYATASYLALLLFPKTRPAAWMMTRTITAPVRGFRSWRRAHA